MQKVNTKNIFFIAIISICIILAFALYHNRAEIFKLFSNEITPYKEDTLPVKDNDTLANDNTTQTTKSSSAKFFINHTNSFDSPTPTITTDYRTYLLNVNLLIFNFLQDKSYSEELQAIEVISLPLEIKNILIDLDKYNNDYLLSKIEDSKKVFPTDKYSWLEKFIKIKKKSAAKNEQEKSHAKILKKLEFFINFFYSEKFIK